MIEVLIVGAGSVGLMTALGLAREGISVTSRDRRFRRRLCVHMTKDLPLTSQYHVRSIPPGFRVRAGFDSGRGDCGDRNGMGVPMPAGESHMDLLPLLRCFASWILRTAPTCWRESNGEVQEGFPTFGGPAGGQCAARSAGGIGYRLGGGPVRSRDLLGYGGVWTSQGRAVAAVPAAGARGRTGSTR
jgi:hypothetical protein